MSLAVLAGLAAGALQALAYVIYIRQVIQGDCRPNGMSWLMWTYGTAVFFYIEADMGAPPAVLILPGICAACSVVVSAQAFLRASYVPPERQDWAVLSFDLAILIGYLALLYGPWRPQPGLALVFVLLPAVSATVASWPILRTTCLEPRHERPLAWFVWSAAYALMALAVMGEGLPWPYLAYPVLSQAVHLLIGFAAMKGRDSVPAAPRGRAA